MDSIENSTSIQPNSDKEYFDALSLKFLRDGTNKSGHAYDGQGQSKTGGTRSPLTNTFNRASKSSPKRTAQKNSPTLSRFSPSKNIYAQNSKSQSPSASLLPTSMDVDPSTQIMDKISDLICPARPNANSGKRYHASTASTSLHKLPIQKAKAAKTPRSDPPRRFGGKNSTFGNGIEIPIDMNEAQRHDLENIRTSDDAINFFARHGQDSAVKFFYCISSSSPLHFCPYELTVVPKEEITAEHYIISANGVVHMESGNNSEVTSLSEWIREKSIYESLCEMRTFKFSLVFLMFRTWRKSVRQKLYHQVREKIKNSLFLAKPTFVPSLLEIRGLMHDVMQVKLMTLSTHHQYSVTEFGELQNTQRSRHAQPKLDNIVDKTQQCLEKLCREVIRQAKLYREGIRDEEELNDFTGVNLYQGRKADKSKSMSTVRKEKIKRAKDYHRVNEEVTMLGRFIRVADYMLIESLVACVVDTTAELLQILESLSNEKTNKAIFTTTIAFTDDTISFMPDAPDVLATLNENLIDGMINTVQATPRLILLKSFAHFFDKKSQGLKPIDILEDEPKFKELRYNVNSLIQRDFTEAKVYAKVFEDLRSIYEFGKTWTAEKAKNENKTVADFRQSLTRQREWRQDLDRMKTGNVIGVLHVDSKALKNTLVPITEQTMDVLKSLLLDTAREECVRVLGILNGYNRSLSERPTELDDFVEFMGTFNKISKNKKQILQEAGTIDDMFMFLEVYDMKIPTSDQVKLDDVHEAVQKYQAALNAAIEFREDNKQDMISTLEQSTVNLNEDLLGLLANLHAGVFVEESADASDVVEKLDAIGEEIHRLKYRSMTFQEYYKIFKMPQDESTSLTITEKEFDHRYEVWKSLRDWESMSNLWMNSNARELDAEEIQRITDENTRQAYKLGKVAKDDKIVLRLKRAIEDFKEILPVVEELANTSLRDRHWDEIFKIVGQQFNPDAKFTVNDLLTVGIAEKLEEISRVSTNASKEFALEKALDKMGLDWQGVFFNLIPYKDTGTYIISGVDEIQALLDDQIVKIQSMRASPFIKPFEARSSEWETMLSTLQDMLDNWLACQKTWQYLEPIFASEDIMQQLPEEGQKFKSVDTMFKEMMNKTIKSPGCLEIAKDKARLDRLEEANVMLDVIQKGLAAYLEVKRLAFPRFFFLSNDEMLEILSETKDPTRVQPHLKKCFEGVNSLNFQEDQTITAMISKEGEEVEFVSKFNPRDAKGAVEKWLVKTEDQMLVSLKEECLKSIPAYADQVRKKWVLEWPGQVVLVTTAIYWTKEVVDAMREGSLADYEKKCTEQLSEIVQLVRGKLSKLNRATLSALAVMDVHARDVVSNMVAEGISSEFDFEWSAQMRMYFEKESVFIKMMQATVEYGYEYLGNSSRLVVTPLTDRCYRTLMGAIHLNLGGAPEGPAGTGKTESTKDLAKALARQCVVFNCSDTLDVPTMAKFFKGLASSGAWACFDEFNRIDLEVLSVIAQQVLEIQRAVAAKVEMFFFEGSELVLRPTCNVFITMNPGYAGRSELPDNLKALFRTVAMMVPDYALIAEIILLSNGYQEARDCARKIVATYRLCSEQLSSQDHYDYGMRAVMAVLRAAANLKRTYPEQDEYILMLRSIIDVNLCKFLSHDVPLFNGIVSDLFPGLKLPSPDYVDIEKAISKSCKQQNLQLTDYFKTKIFQLYEMIIVRHGLMVVGLPFSGKSCALKVLSSAITDLANEGIGNETPVKQYILNPKSVTMGQLYGFTDPITQEWNDGVLAVYFRKLAADESNDRKWLILDGPVDAIWIENMNTVLDDNKKLCLPNSEIVQMAQNMNLIFEVADLAVASPATVSRCGMVYLEPNQLGWRPLMESWIATLPEFLPEQGKTRIRSLMEWLVDPGLRYVRREVKEIAPTEDSNLVQSLMVIFLSLIKDYVGESSMQENDILKCIDALFIFSLVWSIGCTGPLAARQKFDMFLRSALLGVLPADYLPVGEGQAKHIELIGPKFPEEEDVHVHDYIFDKESMTWKRWTDVTPKLEIPNNAKFSEIIVPTADSARYTFLLDLCVRNYRPILFVGPTGTGKTVYVQQYLLKLPKEEFLIVPVSFSARTSANMTQEQIDGRLDKKRRGIYGPPAGKRCIMFVDDLNMPQLEEYGAQPPIELLRQFMDYSGWYGRNNAFREMVDCLFIAAMGPPGGGRNPVTSRYIRHFSMVGVSEVADETLSSIFTTILDWHLSKGNFSEDIRCLCPQVISSTLEVYRKAMSHLLPTPTKSHYVFNLRDLARVVQGVMMMPKSSVPDDPAEGVQCYMRLWAHETLRVFYDRLVDTEDREWLLDLLREMIQMHFKNNFDLIFSHLLEKSQTQVDFEAMRKCFFGSYIDIEKDVGERVYSEAKDQLRVLSVLEEYLVDYNGLSKRPMNLAIFLFAAEHISRICRILQQPGGSMLLVGVGGSGRQSLTRLSSYICGLEIFQVEISKSYGVTEWHDDMKNLFLRTGANPCQPTVFLFSETQIKEEVFVEDINNVLNTGEIPNLFAHEEKAQIIEAVRPLATKEGKNMESTMELWKFFVEKVQENLHIVFCVSPIGDAFRERLRQYPSLVNCCTIDWFMQWPSDALEAVAVMFLKDMDLDAHIKEEMVSICKTFHQMVQEASDEFLSQTGRHNYVTPTSFLELISAFKTLLSKKREDTMAIKRRYEVGLEKLNSSAQQVAGMQEELTALQPQLAVTVTETEELMKKIDKEKREIVEPKKTLVKEEEAAASVKADEAKAIRDECESALAEAVPALNEAISALDTLKPADINYVKNLKNPPTAVKVVMEAVCVILEVKPGRVPDPTSGKMTLDYWPPSVKLLNDKDFLGMLKGYDKDNIPEKIISKIRENYVSNPDFTPERAANASAAAEGLCKWVLAMDKYDKVAKIVAPKKESLKEAEARYEEVMVGLRAKQGELKAILDKLEELEKQLEGYIQKKEKLENEMELCKVKLERAEKLIGGLRGEKLRWTQRAEELGIQHTNLTGDMLVGAGVISYLGAFTAKYRDQIQSKWVAICKEKKIPSSDSFSFISALGDPVSIREWLIAGLPNDPFSINNGIVVANARRWPLMIDPQGQANKWVKNLEKPNNLQVIKLSDGSYLRSLENAIQFGLPVLLENIGEELDPSLEPLLLKQVFKSGGVNCIRLGDSVIEYSSDFKFYLTTKMRNPHYLPEVAVKVTLLNFTITLDGLADQLLGVVVAKERPDLEQQKNELVVQSAANKKKLKEIEDKILQVLSSSEGNILEDETAIMIISEAKELGNEIDEKQKISDETEKEIDKARTGYKPSGEAAAVLFFCITDLGEIEPMYQYSLPWFVNLFIGSIEKSEKSEQVSERLTHIGDHFRYSLYANVCRSLFEKDKLLFAFLLAIRILEHDDVYDSTEWMFLLTGGTVNPPQMEPNPASEWLSDDSWEQISRLNEYSNFKGLTEQVSAYLDEYRAIFDSTEPQSMDFPELDADRPWTPFRRLLLLRCLRPDKVIPAVQEFVEHYMGKEFIQPPPFNLEACFTDSSPICPLIFVLSPGSDPTAALLKFADDNGYGDKIQGISLGQGQGPKAEKMIREAVNVGSWVILQNCHLAPSWMPSLEKICEEINLDTASSDFRLWMTSYASKHFPVSILQSGIKMTTEPPKGVRANMMRSYFLDPMSNQEFFSASKKPDVFKRLLFGLVFFHAIIQERRKFGPLGWNIPYAFDDGDLRISVRQLQMMVDEQDETPFKALRYVTGECNYGGRVTDDKDRILLNTLLENVYCREMTESGYKLSASGLYQAPEEGPISNYVDYIESLPLVADPEVFGLHENANITKDRNDTAELFRSLLATQSSSSGDGGSKGAEDTVKLVVSDILKNLPQNFDIEKVQSKFPIRYEESFNTVLAQEMVRFNRLTTVIRLSLQEMERAIAGFVVMSSEIEKAYLSMAVNKVPELWLRRSYPSLKPLGSYMADLYRRLDMLEKWYQNGNPTCYWMSGFFFVQSFLTASMQNFARKKKVPIDIIAFDFEMKGMNESDYTTPPSHGVYVYGLYLEGCGWSSQSRVLCESQPKELFVSAPVMWFKPKPIAELTSYPHYNCPLYRTSDRRGVLATTGHSTNFVMKIRLPTDHPESHWIKRGVALISQLST